MFSELVILVQSDFSQIPPPSLQQGLTCNIEKVGDACQFGYW